MHRNFSYNIIVFFEGYGECMNKFKITDTVNYKKYGIVKKVLKRCLKMEGVHNSFFEVILVDNNTIQKINKEYRNIVRVTDVI